MKASLPLLFCLAAFPCLSPAQPIAVPTSGVQDRELEALISKPVAPDQLALRAQQRGSLIESPSLWTTWTSAPWEIPFQETLPTVSFGRYEFHASGFAVNAFGPVAVPDRNWAESLFGTNITHPFVAEPLVPRAPTKYFRWGERDQPWSNVDGWRQPEGVLLSLHF